MNRETNYTNKIDRQFHLNNYIEIEKYLNKIYSQSRLNPLASLYLHTSLKSQMLQQKIKKQIGTQISLHYFNNVQLLAHIKLTRDIPAIIVCQSYEQHWLDQFNMKEGQKICGYTSYGKLESMDLLFNFIQRTYQQYKYKTYNVVSETAIQMKQSSKQKKMTLNLYYNKQNQDFCGFMISKGNMGYLYDKINPFCYQNMDNLIELVNASKSSEARIIIAQSKYQAYIKQKIPKNKSYKLLLDNLNNNQLSYTQQVNQVYSIHPYQKLISAHYINIFISQQMEQQTQFALNNFVSSTNRILLQKFKYITKHDNQIQALDQRLQRLGNSEFSILVIQNYQLKESQQMILNHNFANVLIIQHYMEDLLKKQQIQSLVLFQYCKINELIKFLSEIKQDILISNDPIFGVHVKKLYLYASKKDTTYNFLQKYQNPDFINIKIYRYQDHKNLSNLLTYKKQNKIVSLIICSEKQLMNLYRYKVISAYDKTKIIVYPTHKNAAQFGGTVVALACKKQEDVCNFLNGFTQKLQHQQQQYPQSIIKPNQKIKIKSIKRYQLKKQHFILPEQGKSKVHLYMPYSLKKGECKIFKNRMIKILKNDIFMQQYEKIDEIISYDYSLDPLCYIIVEEEHIEWITKFAEKFKDTPTLKIIIFTSLNPVKKEALNYNRIKLITNKFNEIQKYIFEDIKKYQKKYLALLNKIYKQFIGQRNQNNPTKIYCTFLKLMNISQDTKLAKISKFGTYEEILKHIKTQSSKQKCFIVINYNQQKNMINQIKNKAIYLLIIGGKIPDVEHNQVLYRSTNDRQMQNFIKKIFFKNFQSNELIRTSKQDLSDHTKKKYLLWYPSKLNQQMVETPDIQLKGYNKIQQIVDNQNYEMNYVILANQQTNVQVLEKIKNKIVFRSQKSKIKNSQFIYKQISDVVQYLQNISQYKKQEMANKWSSECSHKLIILYDKVLKIEQKNSDIKYKSYQNINQLQDILLNIQFNKIYHHKIIILISIQIVQNLRLHFKSKYFFVIYHTKNPQIKLNLPKKYVHFINQQQLIHWVNHKISNLTFKQKQVIIQVQNTQLFQKIQYRLQIRQSRPSTKITLSIYTDLQPIKSKDQILIVSYDTYLKLKDKQKGENEYINFVIYDQKEMDREQGVIMSSNDENQILSLVGNLQKTQKIVFLEFQKLFILCQMQYKEIFINHFLFYTVVYFSGLEELFKLIDNNREKQPLVIIKQTTQSQLIYYPSMTFYHIIYSTNQYLNRPIYQNYTTLYVSNKIDNITKYIDSLISQQKVILYPQSLQHLYRKQKHMILNNSKFKASLYSSLGQLNDQLKKYDYRVIFYILCEQKLFNSTNVIVQDNKTKFKFNTFKMIVFIENGQQKQIAGVNYIKKINFQKQYELIFGLKKQKIDKKIIKNYQQPISYESPVKQSQQDKNQNILFTKKIIVHPKQQIIENQHQWKNQSSSKTFKKTASFGPKQESNQIQSKIQSIKQMPQKINESSRQIRQSYYTEQIRSNQMLRDSIKIDQLSQDYARSQQKSLNFTKKNLKIDKNRLKIQKVNSNRILNNSQSSQFVQFVGVDSFAKKMNGQSINNIQNNQIYKKNKNCTLLLQAQRKQLKSIIIGYQNNFQNTKILKYLNKQQFNANMIKILQKKEEAIIVLSIQRQQWIQDIQLQNSKLNFILIGKNQQKYGNKVYIKNYYTLLDEIINAHVSKGLRIKRSVSNTSLSSLVDSEKKNKQKIILIKKVKDNKQGSGNLYKNSEQILKGIQKQLKSNNFIREASLKTQDNYGLLQNIPSKIIKSKPFIKN